MMLDKSVFQKLIERTPLAVLIIGLALFVISAAGSIPGVSVDIGELGWRYALGALSLIVVGFGTLLIWREEKASSLNESLEQMGKTAQTLGNYVEGKSTREITRIIDDTLGPTRDIWLKLLLIRTTLRRLLHRIADSHDMKFSSTSMISSMTDAFLERGIVDVLLAEQIERIRDATYTAEWGEGRPPRLEDVRFTLDNYATVFKALKDRVHS